MKLRMLPCVAIVLVPSARADELCFESHFPLQTANFTVTAVVPGFDPTLGLLTGTRIELSATILGDPAVESFDPVPVQTTTNFRADVVIMRPDLTTITLVMPSVQFVDNLGAYDGTLDFGGTSGVMHLGATATAARTTVLNAPADLTLFAGPPLGSATVALPVSVQNLSSVTAPGGPVVLLGQSVSVDVRVCHVYVPFALRYCASNVSSAACPCANPSPPGEPAGCTASTGFGARFSGSGMPTIAPDVVVLSCSDLPLWTAVLIFQGTARVNAGQGAGFGDGLVCAGGGITRLGVKFATGGAVVYPDVGDVGLVAAGGLVANDVRTYQVWYRDAASFCTLDTFNLSNGVEIRWRP